jgi:hypothetical protein
MTGEERRRRYAEFLRSEEWLVYADAVRERDRWTCQFCGERGWICHHLLYDAGLMPPLASRLVVATCDVCHHLWHTFDLAGLAARIAKRTRPGLQAPRS